MCRTFPHILTQVFLLSGLLLAFWTPQAEATLLDDQKRQLEYRRERGILHQKMPYTPQKQEYTFETGSLWMRENQVWLGGEWGLHVGRCMFTQTQTCQQYTGVILGLSAREGETYGHYLGSLRWQFVHFPRTLSPFVRVYGGMVHVNNTEKTALAPAGGIGYGITSTMTELVDVRAELRMGYAENRYVQAHVGLNIKMDDLLSHFAKKLRDLGVDAVSEVMGATSEAVRGTHRGVRSVLEGDTSEKGGSNQSAPK